MNLKPERKVEIMHASLRLIEKNEDTASYHKKYRPRGGNNRTGDLPAITAAIFAEEIFQNNKKLSSQVYSIMEMARENMERIIENGKENNNLPDNVNTTHVSHIIIGTFRLIVTRWRLSGRSFDLE